MKNKRMLLGAAIVLMAINFLSGDFSAYKQLSPADFAQVIILTLVHFLIKTGVLSALLIGIKKTAEMAQAQISNPELQPQFRVFSVHQINGRILYLTFFLYSA